MRLFALHDQDRSRGTTPVDDQWASTLNGTGHGIFWVPNDFEGRRLRENLTHINYWFVDLDEGTKEEQLARLGRAPLTPSLVIESKNGYHAYWRALDATEETWADIVRWGLVPALKGDTRACDPLRLLRAPGYYHLKDPTDPFLVRAVFRSEVSYTAAQMMRAFPSQEPDRPERREVPTGEGTFWERVAALDGREAIERVSGTWLVDGEYFRLDEMRNGNANIIRADDNYSTPCWVWADGRLGGIDDGNSIAAFCKWYGHSWADIARGLKELFPELSDEEEAEEDAQA